MNKLVELIGTYIVLNHKYDKIKAEYEAVAYEYHRPESHTSVERYNRKLNAFANASMQLDAVVTQLEIELKNNA